MLKIQFVDQRQPSLWLVDQRLSIGRDKANGLVINDEGVSVFHAELRQEDGKLFLWDSGSVNGTFLNGEKVSGKVEVKAGDIIRLHLIELAIVDPSKGEFVLPKAVNREQDKPALPQWQVKALTGTLSGRMFPIDGTKIVGRDAGCDIAVTGTHVSRRHAELSIRGGLLWVKDLGSSNGSFVNGRRAEEQQLNNGDEVKFDAMTFRVVGPAEIDDSLQDVDQTQFRAALPLTPPPAPVPAPKPVAAAAPAPAPKPAPRPAVQPAPVAAAALSSATAAVAEPASKSNTGLLLVVVLIVVLSLGAVFLL